MGDLDLTEFWDHDNLQKLAREANYDAVEMASSMFEELAAASDWLDEGEEAEDYQREIEELAEEVCERFNDDSGSYQDEADQDVDEDEEAFLIKS